MHVLPKGFVRIRHFGFMANHRRSKSFELCRRKASGRVISRHEDRPSLERTISGRSAVEQAIANECAVVWNRTHSSWGPGQSAFGISLCYPHSIPESTQRQASVYDPGHGYFLVPRASWNWNGGLFDLDSLLRESGFWKYRSDTYGSDYPAVTRYSCPKQTQGSRCSQAVFIRARTSSKRG
jgi:hypothetical protein